MESLLPLAPRPSGEERPVEELGQNLEAEDKMPFGWVVFYLGWAVTVTWLYYRNPGFWVLVDRARYWTQLARGMF